MDRRSALRFGSYSANNDGLARVQVRFAALALFLLVVGCDSVEESRFAVEVKDISAVTSSEGPPVLRVRVQNVGIEPLRRVYFEIMLHPQHQLTSGTSISTLQPGQGRTADVKLLNVNQHSEYTCYSSQVIAFAAEAQYAAVDRAGPTTC